jgi:hypothetical protein
MDKKLDSQKITLLQTRFIRLRDAPYYLGMDRDLFNEIVRPYLIQIPIGERGIAFDRLDLDTWADHYKFCNGRPVAIQPIGEEAWDEEECQDSTDVTVSGTLTKPYKAKDFAKVVTQIISKKQKDT